MWSPSFGTFESLKDNYVIYYPAGEATAGAAVEGEPASKHHLCSILYMLRIAYYLLPIAYCLLPIAYYLLSQHQNISI